MRKHFLILMLLSLLPMAGWAEDLTDALVTVVNPKFGHVPTYIGTAAANVVVEGYYADANKATAKTAAEIQAANAGQKFFVEISATGFDGKLMKQFTIEKMPLDITVADHNKTFGGTEPSVADYRNYITAIEDEDGADKKTALQASITIGREGDENVKYNGAVVAGYAYTASISNTNYEIGTVTGTFTINPKTIAGVTIADIANVIYKGSAWTPTPEVKDGTTTLVKDKDYTLSYTNNTDAHDYDHATLAPTVTVTGKGNYNSTTNATKKFSIKPATLLVTPTAKKVYDGTNTVTSVPANVAAFSDNAKFSFQGFVDTKTAADVTWTSVTWGVPVVAPAVASANVGTQALAITANDFTLENYIFSPVEGTFEITQLPITFAVDDYTGVNALDYGEAENYALTNAWKATAIDADEPNLEYAIKITRATSKVGGTGANKDDYELTAEFMTDDEIDAKVDADAGVAAADKAAKKLAVKTARDNYKGTFTKNYVTINKVSLQIALNESKYTLTKVYDAQPVAIELNKTDGLRILGLVNGDAAADVVDLTNLTLTVVDNAADVATYQLTLDGATSDTYDITYIPSQYVITQRPLNIAIADQTFIYNTVANINQTAYTITNDDEDEGLVDDADKVFKLAFDGAVVAVDGTGKVTTTANATPYANAIQAVDVTGATSKWANYLVTMTKGKATILANGATSIVLDQTKDLTETLTAQAYATTGNTCTVSFPTSQRTLKKETWNTLVLPFDITVAALSQKLGYAVVDVLDETNTEPSKVIFKIHMGTIAANTPFMIKTAEEVDLNNIVFTGVKIVAPAATIEAKDVAGNKLTGAYKAQTVADGEYYMTGSGTWKVYEGTGFEIKGERAKFTKSANAAGAPTFFIEEPDGVVTVIEGIQAEEKAVENDGWYTLQGVKLQGAPTQKGVYVRNGKKFVIK